MGKRKVKPFEALKGQPNFTSCSKYSKIVCSMNLPREGDVVNSYLVVIVGYALFLILLGYGIGKHVKGASDFFVGGRSFSWKLLFTTLIAANIGAGSTVGVTGLAYRHGVSSWWWIGCSGLLMWSALPCGAWRKDIIFLPWATIWIIAIPMLFAA